MDRKIDVAIIGGGLVGLATAHALATRLPAAKITVLEKEPGIAQHQSSRNSGVIHSGVYYAPGSLKASLCTQGRRLLESFCKEHGVRYERCGKVIVAVDEAEILRLEGIAERGRQNGVSCTLIGPEELQEFEPHAKGVRALHVPDAGIVDFPGVAQALASRLRGSGHEVRTASMVTGLEPGNGNTGPTLLVAEESIQARVVVNCGGLYSDGLARMAGADPGLQIVPFRGVYYELRPQARPYCRNLIYPVPDPAYPFLGVHLTRMIDGRIEVGPNAVLATGREGYTLSEGNSRELMRTLGFPGFVRLSARHWRKGISEIGRTLSRRLYAREVRRLVPEVKAEDLLPCRSGIRAQALDNEGTLIEDFRFVHQPGIVHVCNAPSPAATACLAIGGAIADQAMDQMPG